MLEVLALVMLSQPPAPLEFEGLASYYTVASSSPLTASGEPMEDDAFTCAMRVGEFGDYFRVTADNGNWVICRLNDRGPYVEGRLIDLSEAAMRKLDPEAGLLHVRVEYIPIEFVPIEYRHASGGSRRPSSMF